MCFGWTARAGCFATRNARLSARGGVEAARATARQTNEQAAERAPVHTSPPSQVTERSGVAEAAGVDVGDIIVELQGEEVPVNMALKEFAERVSCSPSFIRRAPFVGVNQNQPLVRADCDGA